MSQSMKRYGKTALVTGASSGIGKAYAETLAKQGLSLVLVARRKAILDELSSQLADTYGVNVHTISQDLAQHDAAIRVYDRVEQLDIAIDILINNAGYGIHGRFHEISLEQELQMIALSCSTPVALTKLFIEGMRRRNRGAVVFLSSVAGTMPVPFMSTYSASKAFPLLFAESLYGELANTDIDVLAVIPGDTTTEFRQTAGLNNQFPTPSRTSADVVRTTFQALGKTPSIVDGPANKLSALLMAALPKKLAIKNNAKLWAVGD